MVALIIAAHGAMAPQLLASAEMIAGPAKDAEAVTFTASEGPDDLLAKYEAAYQKLGPDVLFLVDLFGGSPFNAAARFAGTHPGTDVVTGVNLPMLIDAITARRKHNTVAALVERACKTGTTGIRTFGQLNVETTSASSADEGDEL